MAIAGKKRGAPSGPASGSGKASKKLKLANKAKSSKSGGAAAPKSSSSLASKQKKPAAAAAERSLGSSAGVTGIPKKSSKNREKEKLKKDKGKGAVKEYVQLAGDRKKKRSRDEVELEEDDGSEDEDESDDDDGKSEVDVDDMLLDLDNDSETGSTSNDRGQDFVQRSAFLTKLDKKELAKSRAFLAEQHRLAKPAPATVAATRLLSTRVQLPKIGPAQVKTNSDDEENLDELSEDDFANMGSSDFDDDDDDDEDGFGSDDSMDGELSEMEGLSDEDEDSLELGSEEDAGEGVDNDDDSAPSSHTLLSDTDEDLEAKYAEMQRKRSKREAEEERLKDKRLPVKLATGEITQNTRARNTQEEGETEASKSKPTNRIRHASESEESEASEDEATLARRARAAQPKANPYGARFGRPAVSSVLEIPDGIERLTACREELATLGREIIAEPELGMNLLRRLLTFTEKVFLAPGMKKEEGLPVDLPVRSLAMLSLLAVFLDIVPGYRIRALTDAEKAARTTQAVIQQREYEEGLVNSYRRFLETCEEEIKSSTPLAPVALKCLCELLKEKSYFNFAINIMEVVVKTLGRREFDSSSELCVATISSILSTDVVGQTSLEIVKLISRTIKARSYLVHPAVLTCLMSLRFQDLGGIRASTDRIDRNRPYRPNYNNYNNRGKEGKGGKGKQGPQQPFINKKARKAMSEKKEIEKEIAEAESTVKEEEKSHNSTETLKLLFALYFRILKLPVEQNSQLLPPALEGLARFSQLVNVDFFRDLLNVLKDIMSETKEVRIQLLCVVTSLELLSGQGEALNIDLSAFITSLYGLLLRLTTSSTIEDKPSSHLTRHRSSYSNLPESELLFRCLHSVFLTSRTPNPPARVLAFSKRLLIAALHWPKNTASKSLEFIRQLLVKERALESMLNTEDRKRDGVYRYEVDEEGLSNSEATVWWELALLETSHFDEEVRAVAARLARWTKED